MNLVGYDSDYYNQQYGSFPLEHNPKLTKEEHEFLKVPDNQTWEIWHKFSVNGEFQYFQKKHGMNFFIKASKTGWKSLRVKYLGVELRSTNVIRKKELTLVKSKHGLCCYCESSLDETNKTREHIVPKSKGGNITKPCCRDCNHEKADMYLRQYVVMLCNQLDKSKDDDQLLSKLILKIKNASLIAMELESKY